jgi:hypothetical protein
VVVAGDALALSPVPQEVVDIVLAERSFRLRAARLMRKPD